MTWQGIENKCEAIVNQQCENAFNEWQENILRASSWCEKPENLQDMLLQFTLEKKHLFFRNFKQKVIKTIEQQIARACEKPLPRQQLTTFESKPFKPINFNAQKDRLFLETYFQCNENSRAAAAQLGIAKSTFHDWKMAHAELIEQEKNKTII